MIDVCLWGETLQIDPHNIGSHEEYVYTRGQCHALALAIHEATGWQLCVMAENENYPVSEVGDHVICITPDGMGVDVNGFQTLEALHDRWGHMCPCFVNVDEQTVWDLGWDEHDMEPAREVAKTILAKAPRSAALQ